MVIGNSFTKMAHITQWTWCHFLVFHFILAPRLTTWIKVLQLVRRLNLITKISWPVSTWNDLTGLAWSSTKDLCLFWFSSGSSVGCVRVPCMPGMEPAMVVIIIWEARLRPEEVTRSNKNIQTDFWFTSTSLLANNPFNFLDGRFLGGHAIWSTIMA